MKHRIIGTNHKRIFLLYVLGVTLLLVIGLIVLRKRRSVILVPSVPNSVVLTEVRVRAVERKHVSDHHVAGAKASAVVAIICGDDLATADRYEARSDALRSIARRRDLPRNDVALLMAYVGSTNDALRAERTAALKNDVLNLLRNQEPVPNDLADLLIGMFQAGNHPPVVLDYCLQHLGAMQDDVIDSTLRDRIRAVLVEAAKRIRFP